MKSIVSISVLLSTFLPFLSLGQGKNHLIVTENTSKAAVRRAIKNGHRIFLNGPLENCEQVIDNAELLLFTVYGKKKILNEKPYHCLSDEVWWHLYGDAPEGSLGGGFEVIINKESREVMKIVHYQ